MPSIVHRRRPGERPGGRAFPEDIVGVAIEWPQWQAAIHLDGAAVSEQVIATT